MNFSLNSIQELYRLFSSSSKGLTHAEAKKNLEQYGKNILPEKKKNRLKMFLLQFHSPLIYILFAAVFISLLAPIFQNGGLHAHDLIDPIAIFAILLLNACFGYFQELKAENTLQALKSMQPNISTVLRNGKKEQISREFIVPGDVLALSEGDKIPADARLIEAHELKVIESALTGESAPVKKDPDWKGESGIADQKNMLFSGTSLATGRATALVVATGEDTQIGRIATLVAETVSPKTPLTKRMERLGKQIGLVVIFLCALVFFVSYTHGISFVDALITAVALAVSAVPEGLPAVMTISLAVGVGIMAKKKAIVRELRAVETLGSVTVIASDKTGTITQNKMRVVEVYVGKTHEKGRKLNSFGRSPIERKILEVAANCNDAELPNLGDPTELALLEFAQSAKRYDRLDETPFSSETKWMGTVHKIRGKKIEFIKGAPEVVAAFCSKKDQEEILAAAEKMAKEGLRTIAVTLRPHGRKTADFLGILGLLDPPRKTAKSAIGLAKKAGIRTVMITGDHAITAQTIAKKVGLSGKVLTGPEIEDMSSDMLQRAAENISVFARVSPEHKVRICAALQQNGHVVAMTGDGVNDAPAIHRAEVGVSMGKVGTSVARQASDLVLMDDCYATIVAGVEEGRRIYSNIKKSISYLMRTNFGGIFLIMLSVGFGLPLPLLPIHILFINLVTDSLPALSLAMEPPEKNIMQQKTASCKRGFFKWSMEIYSFSWSCCRIVSIYYFCFGSGLFRNQ
jgi:Ca2+-transporting ATPase